MLCFTLQLPKKQTIYQLSTLISDQYPNDRVVTYWRELTITASPDNTHDIKRGCSELSGIRYAKIMAPGESKTYNGSEYINTVDFYFLCEEADHQAISVEMW